MTITKIHQLPTIFGGDLHREAGSLVERARNSIAWKLHSRDETFRLLVYNEFLWQTCDALLNDGGPAVALRFLKDVGEFVRAEATDRARNAVGPFLSPTQLSELIDRIPDDNVSVVALHARRAGRDPEDRQ